MKASKPYSLEMLTSLQGQSAKRCTGGRRAWFDRAVGLWRMQIQLEEERIWFLTVFMTEDGQLEKYSLDRELAEDSHFEFRDETALRDALYAQGDEQLLLDEILSRVIAKQGGNKLLTLLRPLITAEYHFD